MGKRAARDVFPGRPRPAAGGFSLIELLIAMAIGLVILGALYGVFTQHNKTFSDQEEVVALQQNVRAAMDLMAREIGMAGFDPAGVNSDADGANNFSGVTVSGAQLRIRADLDGSGGIANSDPQQPEDIVYTYDATNKRLMRDGGTGSEIFAEHIDAFTFQYRDGGGAITTDTAAVRQIGITITGRTAKPDPAYGSNGGYRTCTLTSTVTPRNLAY